MSAWIEMPCLLIVEPFVVVALLVSAWIEISMKRSSHTLLAAVALLVSAWIEMLQVKRGQSVVLVALLVSAWIEIQVPSPLLSSLSVALLVSAWIEIAGKPRGACIPEKSHSL